VREIRTLCLTWRELETFLIEGGAPVLDPTDEGGLEIEPLGHYASSLLYCYQRPRKSSEGAKVFI
jgi:hypothetical protein